MIRIGSIASMIVDLLVCGGSLAVLPSSGAHAACAQWDLSGAWDFYQTNNYRIWFRLQQAPDGKISGMGGQYGGDPETGTVSGSMNGDQFSFVAEWGVARGKYEGKVGPNGELQGSTSDLNHPQVTAKWHEMFGKRAGCMDVAASPASPPKAVKKLGKRLPGTSTTSTLPQSLFATAKDEVDIHEGPGGQFNVLQCQGAPCTMKEGGKAKALDHQEGWYKLKGVADGADGWVAEDHLTVSTK
jgi:hypothetical protein